MREKENIRKIEKEQLISPSRQGSSMPVGFGQRFLSKDQCDSTGAYLAPADFYLFPRPKWTLKVQGFCDATDIITNATEELKVLS
jgi:hypothetical protein